MQIRKALDKDADKILALLAQVEHIHYLGRPDIFRLNGTKFTAEELRELMRDESRPIFVAEEDGEVVGYTFCIINEVKDSTMLLDAKTLHLEDVCVDESKRDLGVGGRLMEFAKSYAKEIGCVRIDLDVWEFNDGARRFYEKYGFTCQKRRMDLTL